MAKFNVTFVRSFGATQSGVSFTTSCENNIPYGNITNSQMQSLRQLGVVKVEKVSEPLKINTECPEYDKLTAAVTKDFDEDNYAHEDAYIFYSIEAKAWKKSKLLKTASHIGRVVSGFAIPVDASDKKKLNRLRNLNAVYSLGLTDSQVKYIAATTPTDE